ncbi:hypothetical protein C8R47DRAFT_1081456 [Mycena vitilis]|nr:hypothetical protein C8R47DRAFT_1081456 [Mycena vitilis]
MLRKVDKSAEDGSSGLKVGSEEPSWVSSLATYVGRLLGAYSDTRCYSTPKEVCVGMHWQTAIAERFTTAAGKPKKTHRRYIALRCPSSSRRADGLLKDGGLGVQYSYTCGSTKVNPGENGSGKCRGPRLGIFLATHMWRDPTLVATPGTPIGVLIDPCCGINHGDFRDEIRRVRSNSPPVNRRAQSLYEASNGSVQFCAGGHPRGSFNRSTTIQEYIRHIHTCCPLNLGLINELARLASFK